MTLSTFEEAVEAAAVEVSKSRCCGVGTLDQLESDLEAQRPKGDALVWSWVAADGLCGLLDVEHNPPAIAYTVALSSVVQTVISKQHDYGHDNILWGGREGIVIRAHDKVARIKNLRERAAKTTSNVFIGPGTPLNESIEDSWRDIVGYALIGYMLESGTFELPLAADVAPTGSVVGSHTLTWSDLWPDIPRYGKFTTVPNFDDFDSSWPTLDEAAPPLFDAEEEEAIRDVVSAMPFTFDFGEADEDRIRELAKEVVDAEVEDFDVLERRVKAWIGDGLAEYKTTVRSLISEAITSHWFVSHNKPSTWTLVGAR